MSAEAFILDGYVDEPACLGVPPYISPYIRTVAGSLIEHEFTVRYRTIDQLRKDPHMINLLDHADLLVMIAGVTVRENTLVAHPRPSMRSSRLGHMIRNPKKLIGGPIGFGYAREGGQRAIKQVISGFDALLTGEPAIALDNYLTGNNPAGLLDYDRTDPMEYFRAAGLFCSTRIFRM